MTDPTEKSGRARPARRFSQMQPAVRRAERPAAAATSATDHAARPIAPRSVTPQPVDTPDEARVAKVMSRAGVCSRRDAEAWIKAGRVAINGTVIHSPALNIGPDDAITVDGAAIDKAERTRLFLFHKTRGLVTTAKDPEDRPTIFDALPDDLPRLMTVGRLDINTEGLLLLTNDGGLARSLELPATGWLRRYRVRAKGSIDQASLDALAEGITIEGVDYAGIEAALDREQGANVWLTMGLREGKNREIKKVLEHLGLTVNRLIRVSFGPFQLGDLPEGAVEEVKTRVLRDQLGTTLARQAGVDFEGPVTATVVTRDVREAKGDERRAKEARDASSGRTKPARTAETGRKHVSALRADRADALTEGPRRKTQRGATEDRKGRAVAVERITTVGQKRGSAAPGRNERKFDRDRLDDAAVQRPRVGRPTGTRTLRESDDRRFARTSETRPPREDAAGRGTAGERPRFRSRADGAATKDFAAPRRDAEFKPRRGPPERPVRHGHDAERPPRAGASKTRDRPDRGAGRERDPERASRAPSGEGRREPGPRFARATRFDTAAPGRSREDREGAKPARRPRFDGGKPGGSEERGRGAASTRPAGAGRPPRDFKKGGSDRPRGGSDRPGGGPRPAGGGRPPRKGGQGRTSSSPKR